MAWFGLAATHPNDCVEFGHRHLLGSLHRSGYLLLVLNKWTRETNDKLRIENHICIVEGIMAFQETE
jgi:hypothetical protein